MAVLVACRDFIALGSDSMYLDIAYNITTIVGHWFTCTYSEVILLINFLFMKFL